MIVVLARPRVYRPQPDGDLAPGGLGVEVALALGRAGADVELVGSMGDDPEGDHVVVALGRAGVGHAALLRDPATRTPPLGDEDGRPLPRLEAADVELGLRYVPACRVLIIAEDLDGTSRRQALETADYHGATVIVIASPGSLDPASLPDGVTLLERPTLAMAGEDGEESPVPLDARRLAAQEVAFARLVADYASRLADGLSPAKAFRAALERGAWEPSAD